MDAAHELLYPCAPTRSAVLLAGRTVTAAALELAAATAENHRVESIRADPVALANSGLESVGDWCRHRRMCRRRLFSAVQAYLVALQALTAESSRGAWISDDEPVAADFKAEARLFLWLLQHGQYVPF